MDDRVRVTPVAKVQPALRKLARALLLLALDSQALLLTVSLALLAPVPLVFPLVLASSVIISYCVANRNT